MQEEHITYVRLPPLVMQLIAILSVITKYQKKRLIRNGTKKVYICFHGLSSFRYLNSHFLELIIAFMLVIDFIFAHVVRDLFDFEHSVIVDVVRLGFHTVHRVRYSHGTYITW